MNEWIDFAVFAVQAIIMFIALPIYTARFTRPMLSDRNRGPAGGHGQAHAA